MRLRHRRPRRPILLTPGLFDPPRVTPAWADLPPDTRAEAQRLLTRLLADHARRRPAGGRREVGHE